MLLGVLIGIQIEIVEGWKNGHKNLCIRFWKPSRGSIFVLEFM